MKPFLIFALSSLAFFSCTSQPKVEVTDNPESETSSSINTTAQPSNCQTDTVAGLIYSYVSWEAPSPELSNDEKKLVGCWVAEVSDISIKTGGVALNINKNEEGKNIETMEDLTNSVVDAIKNNDKMKTSCIWLYLYNDHTGFWSTCADMVAGPAELQSIDVFTGKNQPMGISFNWYFKDKTIHFQFTDCLKVPYINRGKLVANIKVRYWDIKLLKKINGEYSTEEYFPEYKYTLPVKNKFSYSKETGEKIKEYKEAILD